VPSDEPEQPGETAEVLSDPDLVRDLLEGLAEARAGRVYPAAEIAADLAARWAAED
jgi:hypothetical protein